MTANRLGSAAARAAQALARWARRRPTRPRRSAPARPDPRTVALRLRCDGTETEAPTATRPCEVRVSAGRADQHRLAELVRRGVNISPVPYGYRSERIEPSGRARLVPDPPRDRVVAQIFTWRVHHQLDIGEITTRLRSNPDQYPPPGRGRWSDRAVAVVLSNPRYTGYQVWRYRDGATGLTPPDRWVISDRPAHPPLTTVTTYLAAQCLPEHTKAALRRRLRRPPTPRTR